MEGPKSSTILRHNILYSVHELNIYYVISFTGVVIIFALQKYEVSSDGLAVFLQSYFYAHGQSIRFILVKVICIYLPV